MRSVHATSVFMGLGMAAAAINAWLVLWLSAGPAGFYLMPAGKFYLVVIGGAVAVSLTARLAGWRLTSAILAMLQFGPLLWCIGLFVSLAAGA